MPKIDWHYLCLEILMNYIKQNLDVFGNSKRQEMFEHYMVASQTFGERMGRNLNGLSVEDKAVFENKMQMSFENTLFLMNRITYLTEQLARQGLGFFMEQLRTEGLQEVANFLEEKHPEIIEASSKYY